MVCLIWYIGALGERSCGWLKSAFLGGGRLYPEAGMPDLSTGN
jgi:hypothetical protein